MSTKKKFKAYHRGERVMIPNESQGYEGQVFQWLHEGQPIEILQHSGFNDKHGVGIYEKDKIEYKMFTPRKYIKGVMVQECEIDTFTRYVRCDFERGFVVSSSNENIGNPGDEELSVLDKRMDYRGWAGCQSILDAFCDPSWNGKDEFYRPETGILAHLLKTYSLKDEEALAEYMHGIEVVGSSLTD
jgi:hypothetical protein